MYVTFPHGNYPNLYHKLRVRNLPAASRIIFIGWEDFFLFLPSAVKKS